MKSCERGPKTALPAYRTWTVNPPVQRARLYSSAGAEGVLVRSQVRESLGWVFGFWSWRRAQTSAATTQQPGQGPPHSSFGLARPRV